QGVASEIERDWLRLTFLADVTEEMRRAGKPHGLPPVQPELLDVRAGANALHEEGAAALEDDELAPVHEADLVAEDVYLLRRAEQARRDHAIPGLLARVGQRRSAPDVA